jgi:hypothetical protein
MAKNHRRPKPAGEVEARRKFIKQVGKAAATAPAVALLVAASAKPASAQYSTRLQPRRGKRRPSGVLEVEVDE